MIVFGWNSFKLHGCKPSQIGLPEEFDKEFAIERRQKYFHIFWIPFFGIGKNWYLRKHKDNGLYEPTAELHSFLESLPYKEKTPWYTFSLFWLILAGGTLYVVSDAIDDFNRRKSHERWISKRNADFEKSVQEHSDGNYFRFTNSETSKVFYLKSIRSDDQSLYCLYSDNDDYRFIGNDMLGAFVPDSLRPSFDTLRLSKADLLKTLNRDDVNGFRGYELIQTRGKAVLDGLQLVRFPVFKEISVQYSEGKFLALLKNIGAPGKIKTFLPQGDSFKWINQPSENEVVGTDALFFIEGTYTESMPRFRAKLEVATAQDSVAEFTFYIRGKTVNLEQQLY